jgi:hypothetical protein
MLCCSTRKNKRKGKKEFLSRVGVFQKIKNKWKYVYKAIVGISCSRVVTKLVGITFLLIELWKPQLAFSLIHVFYIIPWFSCRLTSLLNMSCYIALLIGWICTIYFINVETFLWQYYETILFYLRPQSKQYASTLSLDRILFWNNLAINKYNSLLLLLKKIVFHL